jgi:3-deoxy-manno-octulosonate cytidylyltransferase (CMP-KDO synthetase)
MLRDSGAPLFLHTVKQAQKAKTLSQVFVASDSPQVIEATEQEGVQALPTSTRPRTGSERCAEALNSPTMEGSPEIIIDVQGDWPEVAPMDLDRLVEALIADPSAQVATLACPLDGPEDLSSPHVVKVLTRPDQQALYFSRAPIPGTKEGMSCQNHWKEAARHVGVYAFRRKALLGLSQLPDSRLEKLEELEQLRWLEAGWRILVLNTDQRPRGIETLEDYKAFLQRI